LEDIYVPDKTSLIKVGEAGTTKQRNEMK